MDQQQAVNVNAEAQSVRSAIAQCFALADTANTAAALERVTTLGTIFRTHTQDAVKEAISLTKATKAGIKAKSTMYNRLSQSKAFYACFLRGEWNRVAGDTVELIVENDDGSEETIKGTDWNLRYKVATTLNRQANEALAMAAKVEAAIPIAHAVLHTQGIEATDENVAGIVQESIQRQRDMLDALRDTPTETAKRTVKTQWKDKGSNWCIQYATAYAKEVERMVVESIKGAIHQPTPARIMAPSPDDLAAGEPPLPNDLQSAKDAAAAARKAVAANLHADKAA